MNGAGCRRKGHDFEREVAALLRPIFGEGVRRGLQYQDGTGAPDVIGTPFHIECKRGRKTNIRAAMEQGSADSDTRNCASRVDHGQGIVTYSKLPVVAVTREDARPAMVTMYLEDWLALVREARGGHVAA